MEELPYSQACENNKQPILKVIQELLADRDNLLEIGGGTGQHAEFFAKNLPHLRWQSTDIPAELDTLNLRIERAALPNLPTATALDVTDEQWPCARFDAVFTANTLHIMPASSVAALFATLPQHLNDRATVMIYGPFRYGGEFTTESNARFDNWLKDRNPLSGVRDFEWVSELAEAAGLRLSADHAMPANNQLLVWET